MAGMKDLATVKRIIFENYPYLTKEYKVKKIGVFGSFVFGDNQKGSDIDILVEFTRPIGLFEFVELENYLSDKLGRKVDLVSKDGLKKYIKKDILNSTVYV